MGCSDARLEKQSTSLPQTVWSKVWDRVLETWHKKTRLLAEVTGRDETVRL